jgi:uncharacterized membrane protein
METFFIIIVVGVCVAFFVRKRQMELARQREQALDEAQRDKLDRRSSALGIGGGAAIWGAIIGSFFGVAGFGGAISGIIPGALIGGVIGYLMMNQQR